jgi:hypothetical protein
MLRILATIVAVVAMNGLSGGIAAAKPCRDAHGKFTKCVKPMKAAKRCRDDHGKFIKCSAMHKM